MNIPQLLRTTGPLFIHSKFTDFRATSELLTFLPDDYVKNNPISITDDIDPEISENFTARLSMAGGMSAISNPSVPITIHDDDSKDPYTVQALESAWLSEKPTK